MCRTMFFFQSFLSRLFEEIENNAPNVQVERYTPVQGGSWKIEQAEDEIETFGDGWDELCDKTDNCLQVPARIF